MKLVIDIHEEAYKEVCGSYLSLKSKEEMRIAIKNGTPLPKGHGTLKDIEPIYDKLIRSYRADEKDYPNRGKDYRVGLSNAIDLLNNAPTIIEADKESEDKE